MTLSHLSQDSNQLPKIQQPSTLPEKTQSLHRQIIKTVSRWKKNCLPFKAKTKIEELYRTQSDEMLCDNF